MIADIAAVFHWPHSELAAMDFAELILWRGLAVERWNKMRAPEK